MTKQEWNTLAHDTFIIKIRHIEILDNAYDSIDFKIASCDDIMQAMAQAMESGEQYWSNK